MSDGTSAGAQSDEHREPAALDWPKGIEETSLWPLLTAVGVGTIYLGAALTVVSVGAGSLLPVWPGPVTFLGGVGLFLAGLFGWLYHGFVARYWERGTDAHDRLRLRTAMVLFLCTEVATFGGGFAYYFFIRAGAWPPEPIPHLISSLVLVNTGILVASSITMHLAHRAIESGDHTRFERLTGLTIALGLLFLAGQVYEYAEFVLSEGFTLTSGLFASAFFGLTGLHGLHVSLGVVVLGIVFVRGWSLNQYDETRLTSVRTASMYWHFVDAVWLFLVASLYVGASVQPV